MMEEEEKQPSNLYYIIETLVYQLNCFQMFSTKLPYMVTRMIKG